MGLSDHDFRGEEEKWGNEVFVAGGGPTTTYVRELVRTLTPPPRAHGRRPVSRKPGNLVL